MSQWEARTVREVVLGIRDAVYVLPVIQRRLVWNEENMVLLFDSLLKGNSFGGIMVLEEDKDESPLFAFREFSLDGGPKHSREEGRLDQKTYLVIDGQQRLQSFYMGLMGGINGKRLFFNLFSPSTDYEFKFANEVSDLPRYETDDSDRSVKTLWHPTSKLFGRLVKVQDEDQVTDEIAQKYEVNDYEQRRRIASSVRQFYRAVIAYDRVGLSSVTVNRSRVEEERQRIVELFRRLNSGGTRLSAYDLVASVFKGLDYRMEQFFRDIKEFSPIHLYQDEIIKLIFLLQDEHAKEVMQITKVDTDFALNNQERIFQALRATLRFLENAELDTYYKVRGRSIIPLQFIAYHVYHKKDTPDAELHRVYDNYDTNNPDFLALKRWIYLSVLNGVFSRGCGWIPYKAGFRKILNVLKYRKGEVFPTEELFSVYASHPVHRFSEATAASRIDIWDRDFVFYIIYKFRIATGRDIDHIQPRSKLYEALPKEDHHLIDSLANYQLLDPETNRDEKRAKTFREWVTTCVTDRTVYLDRHLIPKDETLWPLAEFKDFRQKRAEKITQELSKSIPDPLPTVEQSELLTETRSDELKKIVQHTASYYSWQADIFKLREQIPEKYREHPVLNDETDWYSFYKKLLPTDRRWPGTYRNELREHNIVTVSDLAIVIMSMQIEYWYDSGYAPVYRFHQTDSSDQKPSFKTGNFGGFGWEITLKELERRGFNWREFLVE